MASEYLGNNQRSGYTNATVPREPVLKWTYKERHAPRTAWPEPFGELQFIDFDYSDQVTIGEGMIYFGSSADHTIRALNVGSGQEDWVFYTEGPVRFAIGHGFCGGDRDDGRRRLARLFFGRTMNSECTEHLTSIMHE